MAENNPELKPDLAKLKSYKDEKIFIGEQLRIIRAAVSALGLTESERQLAELMVKLAEDRFTLAVIGQFKRGKSSLMNAIIGRELLPTGVLPLTSAITILKYGPVERLEITYEHLSFPEEQPVGKLYDYVTEAGNPDNQKRVRSVAVELPVLFLRYGIEFVDTPGIGSAIQSNTKTTYDFLPECDAVLFVTGVDTPMTSLELDLLKAVSAYVNKVFFVINKVDLINEDQKKEVLDFVARTVKSSTGHEATRIFEVSSRLALEAHDAGNTLLYHQSGVKELEDALGAFLSEEKSSAFLSGIVQKILHSIDTEKQHGSFDEPVIASRIDFLRQEKVKTVHQEPHEAVKFLNAACEKLQGYCAVAGKDKGGHITDLRTGTTGLALAQVKPIVPAETIKADAVSPEQTGAELAVRSCPVCRHVAESLSDFYAHWQYELSSQQSAQERFAAETGFCPLHTWQLLSMTSPYGASVGLSRLAGRVAGQLNDLKKQADNKGGLWKLVKDSRDCRVCELVKLTEKEFITSLAGLLKGQDGQKKYRRSQGACLRHLAMLLDALPSEMHEFLISHAAEHFEQDAEDMSTYAMKQEALRRGLQNKNEDDAYRRTVIRIVGDRSVCIPWNSDR